MTIATTALTLRQVNLAINGQIRRIAKLKTTAKFSRLRYLATGFYQEFIRKSTLLLQTVHRRHSARQMLTIVTATTSDTRC